jgi:Protein of unknown function
MTNQDRQNAALPRWDTVPPARRTGGRPVDPRAQRVAANPYLQAYRRLFARHQRLIRRVGIGSAVVVGVFALAFFTLWWRLANGPIQLDVATPWLAAAIEENFGSQHKVQVGGTQIERTGNGGAAVRIRDIVVRDADGTVVASAPKAEVRVAGMSLLSGHMRAESLNLVGAELKVRIEQNGDVTIFAGANKHPIATAPAPLAAAVVSGAASPAPPPAVGGRAPAASAAAAPQRKTSEILAALLTWIDGIGEAGLDGHDLRELGLKDGNITVDDARTGKRWSFQDITLSLERPHGGGVIVTVGSSNAERPWGLTAAIKPTRDGARSIELEGRHVSASDLLLAARVDDGSLEANLPLSASLRGEFGPDGVPRSLVGRIVAETGFISDAGGADGRIDIDHAEIKLNWDAMNRVLVAPMQFISGGNRITLLTEVRAPEQAGGIWLYKIGNGTVVLNQPNLSGEALVLNRVAFGGQFDPATKRFVIEGGDVGNAEIGVAMSGRAEFTNGDLHLAAGLAATRMSVDALKRIWPVFVSPKVRDWILAHLASGTVERIVIAVNAPLNTLKASGPPVPDDGLSIDAQVTNCVVQPVQGLPALHDADLNVHIVGRNAVVTLNKAIADVPSGKKLTMSAGTFEVPDTAPHEPPARVRFKLDGPVPAAAELLTMERLRDAAAGAPFDPATTRGTMSANVSLGLPLKADLPPGSTNYAITVDATNFSADRMIMGQKVEAAALKVVANNQGFALKGDVKIGGTPASLEYRKARADTDAEISLQGMLDETARGNFGLDPGNTISGAIPLRLTGRLGTGPDRDGRFGVEADLTPAQLDGFLPGWVKPAGKPARVTFNLATKPQSTRIDDLLIEGAGGGVRGSVELDGSGELQSANFPSYGFADGDRTNLKIDRSPDGALHVVMRGDVYDGRGFIKTMTGSAPAANAPTKRPADIDLDMKLGAVVGYNGEALRSLELKMSRRAGEIRSFGLNAKIGRDAPLTGDLRSRAGGRQVIALTSGDGGALFRFTDVYARMNGGQMVIAMDAPSPDNALQQGSITVRQFAVHDEAQLQHAVNTNDPTVQRNAMEFSSMRVDFDKTPGRVVLRDGVVRGPVLGATIDGAIDYSRDELHLRGTLVPLYGPNNLLGQLPIVGLFLGGEKEGLVGITYEVVGKPGNPVLRINPISALAPGLLRKVFEFPMNNGNFDDSAGRNNYNSNSNTNYNSGTYNNSNYNSGNYNGGNRQ